MSISLDVQSFNFSCCFPDVVVKLVQKVTETHIWYIFILLHRALSIYIDLLQGVYMLYLKFGIIAFFLTVNCSCCNSVLYHATDADQNARAAFEILKSMLVL